VYEDTSSHLVTELYSVSVYSIVRLTSGLTVPTGPASFRQDCGDSGASWKVRIFQGPESDGK